MKLKSLEKETSVNSKVNQNSSALHHRRCWKEPELEIEDGCIQEEEKGEEQED